MSSRKWMFVGLMSVSFAVMAAAVTLYASDPRWSGLANVQYTGISSEASIRSAGAFTMIRTHNYALGQTNPVSVNSKVKIVWQDGSSEDVMLNCVSSPACAQPVPGTQQTSSSVVGGGGVLDPTLSGGALGVVSGALGGGQFANCYQTTQRVGVDVGEEGMKWTTVNVLKCP